MTSGEFVAKKTLNFTKGIEKEIGREYALLYSETKSKLADLYAKIGESRTLEEAQKYDRLKNLIKQTEQSYKRLTGKVLTRGELVSKYNFVQEYYGSMWSAETVHGAFKWKNPAVEAIRASVNWEGTGLSLPKRFGKLFTDGITRVEETITRGLANGTSYVKLANELKDTFTGGLNSALRVIRTESNRNRTEGMNAAFDQMKEAGLPVKKIWISAQDERTRGAKPKDKYNHLILDGLVSDDEGIFDVGQGIGKIEGPTLSGVAGFDINCFLPDTIVSGDFIAGSKAHYSGKVVEIHTASGKRLTITPNHRIATDSGWVKANELTKGMNAISNCDIINRHSCSEVDDQQSVPTIKDVFESIGIHGAFSLSDVIAGLNFDGDSVFMDGAINIVNMNVKLGIDVDSVIAGKGIENINFVITETMNIFMEANGSLDFFSERMLSAFGGNPGFTALPYNGIGILFDFGPFKFFSVGPSSGLNTGLCKESKYDHSSYSKFNAKLFDAFTGIIQFDEIVEIIEYDFSGHVYDLQSIDGYLMSNGIMSSNCRCAVAPFFDDEPRATQAELEASYKAWEAENKINVDAMIDRV